MLQLVERGELTEGHARAVLSIPDHDERRDWRATSCGTGSPFAEREGAARGAGAPGDGAPLRSGASPSGEAAPQRITGRERQGRGGPACSWSPDET